MKVKLQELMFLAVLQLFLLTAVNAQDVNDVILQSEIPNIANPEMKFYASGQPSKQQLEMLKMQGVTHIVNLRPHAEQDWDEKAYVESLGMNYYHIPVEGAEGINHENAAKLDMLLAQHQGEAMLVHCASGNRVGALIALNEGDDSASIDTAIATGKKWGLTGLEPVVREKLTQEHH